ADRLIFPSGPPRTSISVDFDDLGLTTRHVLNFDSYRPLLIYVSRFSHRAESPSYQVPAPCARMGGRKRTYQLMGVWLLPLPLPFNASECIHAVRAEISGSVAVMPLSVRHHH